MSEHEGRKVALRVEGERRVEARFGIGEPYMEQRVYDHAGEIFTDLSENLNPAIAIRANFLSSLSLGAPFPSTIASCKPGDSSNSPMSIVSLG